MRYARKMGIKNVYANYEDLLKNEQLDAVIISLPNFLHLEATAKAAEAGKHILLEKPLARNVEEGKKILSSVRKNGVKLLMGYDLRFNPILRKIHDKIVSGYFGNVQIVEATNISGGPFSPRVDRVGPAPVPSWWFDKKLVGGGALLDLGSHMIDLLSWYFGEVIDVKSSFGYMYNLDLEDVATCVLAFRDGPIATVKVGWFSKHSMQSIQVCGTSKNIWARISPKSTMGTVWGDVARKLGQHSHDANYLELEYFLKCLLNDEQPSPSEEEGLRCLQVISTAYKYGSNKLLNEQVEEV
jgi:predicted dehydrogenase